MVIVTPILAATTRHCRRPAAKVAPGSGRSWPTARARLLSSLAGVSHAQHVSPPTLSTPADPSILVATGTSPLPCHQSWSRSTSILCNSNYIPSRAFSSAMPTNSDDTDGGADHPHAEHIPDFFGEPVTFFPPSSSSTSTSTSNDLDPALAMAALDKHIVATVSKGKSADGGGDEEGIPTKSAHSYALSWVELLERAMEWNCSSTSPSSPSAQAPMLVAAAVSPLLAQTGYAYTRHVDEMLSKCAPTNTDTNIVIQMLPMAEAAVTQRDSEELSPREQLHLHALYHLIRDRHRLALGYYQRILELCPGDALALSLALDVSSVLSDGKAALRAAASVASYWNERGRRGLPGVTNAVQPGHPIGTALIAVGYAAGGRYVEAERLAEEAIARDDAGAGGVAVWALAATYDMEGRASEGTSMLGGYDGTQHYERCGHLFFDSRLNGYGARFALDRDAAGAVRSAGRMYESAFDRIIQYSTEPDAVAMARMAPESSRSKIVEQAGGYLSKLFGGAGDTATPNTEDENQSDETRRKEEDNSKRTAVDVLSWLPATPQVLVDASMLLLRLTLVGAVSGHDKRWRDLKSSWERLVGVYTKHGADSSVLSHCPMARVASSLVLDTHDLYKEGVGPAFDKLTAGASWIGRAMNLGGEIQEDEEGIVEASKEMWRQATSYLAEARHGQLDAASGSFHTLVGWDIDARPLLDQGLCYAAVMSDDHHSLCLARAICSEAVSLRPNSPESWFRYSVVLDRLGDENAAEDARNASVSLGAGEGGRL